VNDYGAHCSFHRYNPLLARPERWLNKITVHAAAHDCARAYLRREELIPDDFVDIPSDAPAPDECLIREQSRLTALELLYQIDPGVRGVLIAHDIDGIAMTEIAAQIGVPLSTAYKWRARAIGQLVELWHQRPAEDSRSVSPGSFFRTSLEGGSMPRYTQPARRRAKGVSVSP